MAKIAEVKYLGQLRTENVHLGSGVSIITDAPVDNHGRGEGLFTNGYHGYLPGLLHAHDYGYKGTIRRF